MKAYYNEWEKYPAEWLRNLIKAKMIPDGDIDERSITDVRPEDLKGYTQCHFFAGVAGWPLALRLAGWEDSREVWTGSCPCQPFSVAGKGKAQADERHLWPHWFKLIAEVRPTVVFGEQVAGAITHGWLDDAFDDLEREGYETGACVLPACSVGAPHKRDRLWFVGYSKHNGLPAATFTGSTFEASHDNAQGKDTSGEFAGAGERGGSEIMADAASQQADAERQPDESGRQPVGRAWEAFSKWQAGNNRIVGCGENVADTAQQRLDERGDERARRRDEPANGGADVADTNNARPQRHGGLQECSCEQSAWARSGTIHPGWQSDAGICRISPRVFNRTLELRTGQKVVETPSRTGMLKAYGNAIVPQVAAEFIRAYMDCRP